MTPAQRAVKTRQKNAFFRAQKLSQAAKKAWATRRANMTHTTTTTTSAKPLTKTEVKNYIKTIDKLDVATVRSVLKNLVGLIYEVRV